MPPRLSKRQQREVDELEKLSSVKSPFEQGEVPVPRPAQNVQNLGFSALAVASDEKSETEDERDVKAGNKSKKKKKKKSETPESAKGTQSSSIVPIRNEKKAARKAKAKESASDDLDQILAELSLQYPAPKISQSVPGRPALTDLLGISPQFLDPEAEMRRFFGSKVVLASKMSESSKGASKKVQHVRSQLVRPKATWWPSQGREGLSLRSYNENEVAEKLTRQGWSPIQEKWWTVEYSRNYKAMTKGFMGAVMAGDPQGLFDQLGTFPWHADTLLQIAEVYRHREEHAQAVDFIEKSVFTYDRCLMGVFNFGTGLNRLDFDRVENRPFFLALHRQVADLQRRGCVRTSFEFARLLYGLDPWSDPHGAIFHLEYLTVRANMYEWLLDLYGVFSDRLSTSENPDSRLNPSLLPGWAYTRALVLRLTEDRAGETAHTNSTVALQQAAYDFPSVVPLLADKLDVVLPSKLRAHEEFKIETDCLSLSPTTAVLHLLSHLYVQRCFPLWKEHVAWFSKTISEMFSTLPVPLPHSERRKAFHVLYEHPNHRYSVYRHILVLDAPFRRLVSFIPREIFEEKSLSCDPLPPPTSLSCYDQDFFHGVDDSHSEHRRRVPNHRVQFQDQVFRQQLQEFFDAYPHLAERFPGGVEEFAQMVAGLPPDLVQEFMLVEALNGPEAMPGGLDGIDIDDGAENLAEFNPPAVEENSANTLAQEQAGAEDEAAAVSQLPRVLRNVFGRLFGFGAAESSSDEQEPLG